MFDISEIAVPETAVIHLEFPGIGPLYADDADTQPVTITVFGPSSPAAVAHRKKVTRDARRWIEKRGMKGVWKQSDDELEAQDLERLMVLTADVSNLTYQGETMTAATIGRVYKDPKMGWLVDQVKERLGSWDDFLLSA